MKRLAALTAGPALVVAASAPARDVKVIRGKSGTAGGDLLLGGPGNDRINVVDCHRDRVRCGRGKDVVFADEFGVIVGSGCENVRR